MDNEDETQSFFSAPVQALYDVLCFENAGKDQWIRLIDDDGILLWGAVADLLNGTSFAMKHEDM